MNAIRSHDFPNATRTAAGQKRQFLIWRSLLLATASVVAGGCEGLFEVPSNLVASVREKAWVDTASQLKSGPYLIYYHGDAIPANEARLNEWCGEIRGQILAIRGDKHLPEVQDSIAGWGLSSRMESKLNYVYDSSGKLIHDGSGEVWWTAIVGTRVSIPSPGKLQFHGPAHANTLGRGIKEGRPSVAELIPYPRAGSSSD